MYDIDYKYEITDDSNEDVVFVVNDYYNQSDICEVCASVGERPALNYVVVKDVKEEPDEDIFFNVDYA